MVILAIGVKPGTEFLKGSNIELGNRGHIIVNNKMQTNINNVYAVGDAVLVNDLVSGIRVAIPLAGPANKQGRIAANNILGMESVYKGTQGTSIIKTFDLTAGCTGNNEKVLKNNNIKYNIVYVEAQSHASYYPGAMPMTIKLIFNDKGDILGSQIIGYEGVDKRIDVISSILRLNGKVNDLVEFEQAYALPYSSAKDPVNIVGQVAENVLRGLSDIALPRDVENIDKNKVVILDIRDEMEREIGSIRDSLNIPLEQLRNRLNELDKSKEIWTYCQVGLRGYIAERILKQNGFKAKNITGGYKVYMKGQYKPIITECNTDDDFILDEEVAIDLDACGLSCPGPLMQVKNSMEFLEKGNVLRIKASDPGFFEDIKAWCRKTDNDLLNLSKENGIIKALVRKGSTKGINQQQEYSIKDIDKQKENKTIVVFSGDLDKAIASFIIANGAATMGRKVTMFFTFWGINILRKNEIVPVKKNLIEKMFGKMMPRGSENLKLSKMNMMGMGSKMIRKIMKDKNVSSLEELIKSAINSGIEIVACQMSLELLGLKKEELIDGIKIGGVGYYLGEAEDSNINLFI